MKKDFTRRTHYRFASQSDKGFTGGSQKAPGRAPAMNGAMKEACPEGRALSGKTPWSPPAKSPEASLGDRRAAGFTLIETLVAISVLVLSLAGPLTIASSALKSAYYARDEVTASYLAQEGLEYVRALRDQNRIASPQQAWLTSLSQCVGANCTVDFVNFTPAAVCSGTCAPLRINNSGLYNQADGDVSRFTRTVTITTISPTEVNVRVSVSWASKSASHSVTASENIYQWI